MVAASFSSLSMSQSIRPTVQCRSHRPGLVLSSADMLPGASERPHRGGPAGLQQAGGSCSSAGLIRLIGSSWFNVQQQLSFSATPAPERPLSQERASNFDLSTSPSKEIIVIKKKDLVDKLFQCKVAMGSKNSTEDGRAGADLTYHIGEKIYNGICGKHVI